MSVFEAAIPSDASPEWSVQQYESGAVAGSRHFSFLLGEASKYDRQLHLYRYLMDDDNMAECAVAHAIPDWDSLSAFREGHVEGFVGTAREWMIAFYHENEVTA